MGQIITLEELNFKELLSTNKIRIPSIQREYTYGNTDVQTTRKRQKFLDFIFDVITGDTPNSLDFIYGYSSGDYIEPLDGQQRLTTLFLLYWLFEPNAKSILAIDNKSKFIYTTRPTTCAFCDAICLQDATILYRNWLQKGDEKGFFSDFLQQQKWFLWQWRQDPSVKSMLNMLNDMVKRKSEFSPNKKIFLENLKFDFLNLGPLDIGENIYVKMNARGKQLSQFDVYKSGLEEKLLNSSLKEDAGFQKAWREVVDGEWLQFFWKEYFLNNGSKQCLPAYNKFNIVEDKYLLVWKRLTALYNLYLNKEQLTDYEFETINSAQYLQMLYKDMNVLLTVKQKSDIIFDYFKKDLPLLKLLIDNDKKEADLSVRAMFLGMLVFIRKYDLGLHEKDTTVEDNFKQYMRVVRNILLNENRNNRLETKDIPAIYENLENMVEQFSRSNWLFNKFLSTFEIAESPLHDGLVEEKTKAILRENDKSWTKLLDIAESDEYLRGQLIGLLQWATPSKQDLIYADKVKFKNYYEKFHVFCQVSPEKRYAALLAFKDYIEKQQGKRTFFTWNQHRDYSWKRALRNKQANVLKKFIDVWTRAFPDKTADEFCDEIIRRRQNKINKQQFSTWRKWVIKSPKVLDMAANKIIDQKEDGHWYLAPGIKFTSNRREIFLYALYNSLTNPIKNKEITSIELCFTEGQYKHLITIAPNGFYNWKINGNPKPNATNSVLFTDQDIWNYFEEKGLVL